MPTILVADDNSNIQKMVSLVFEEKGIRVVAVGNGEAACRKVPEVRPDIVLADVFMPVRNGYEVCEFVKHDPQFADIPVILLVGAFDPLDEKEARRVGADGVLKKPFVPPDPLIAMVTSLLKKNAPPEPEPAPVKEEIPVAQIQQAPPPILPARVPYVSSETEATPEEFTFGMAPRDFEEADGAAPVFSKPVATPGAKHGNDEEDDYEEPASEWKRRRNTMEYDIPAAESANMVEKLAAEDPAPDLSSKIDSAAVHVPFGGANIPEKIELGSTAAPIEWMDLMGSLETKEAEAAEETHEVLPLHPEKQSTNELPHEPLNGSSNRLLTTRAGETSRYASHEELQQRNDLKPGPVSAQQTEWPAPPAEVIPFPVPTESSSSTASEGSSEKASAESGVNELREVTSYSDKELSEATMGSEKAAYQGPLEVPMQVSADQPLAYEEVPGEFHAEVTDAAPASEENIRLEVSAAPSKSTEIDSAAIDSVVAKLLEKLKPQIHEALSNGALRPLVEEILNRERDKK